MQQTAEEIDRALYRTLKESGRGDIIDLVIQLAALKRKAEHPEKHDFGKILSFPMERGGRNDGRLEANGNDHKNSGAV